MDGFVSTLFSGEKEGFHQILKCLWIFLKKIKSHANITISMEKCDICNHLSQYFSSPLLPHLWSLCLICWGWKKKWLFVVICWSEKWAPPEPRQPVFMIIWPHRTIRELKYTMTNFRKAYVIFSHDFSENINRGTDREIPSTFFIYSWY